MSGPSGVGKGTVVTALLRQVSDLVLSISATTRTARPAEVDGDAYRFVSEQEFDRLVAEDAFLEWARVFGNRYGTPAAPIDAARAAGKDAILEIDVQGARSVRERAPDSVLIFIQPPSVEELQRRLLARGTEEDNELARRLTAAEDEMGNAAWFDHVVVNDEVDRAAAEVAAIIERYRRPGAQDP